MLHYQRNLDENDALGYVRVFEYARCIIRHLHVVLYYNSGKEELANVMITLLSLSLALQLIFVVKIHQKNKKRLIKELIATVTFTKNGTNWWRVLTNKKDAEGGISSVSEMMVFLQSEIFAQSTPMAVLQVNAVLESSRIEPAV